MLRRIDASIEQHADSAVLLLFADRADVERSDVDDHTVFVLCAEHLGEDLAQVIDTRIAEAEKIHVSRRAEHRAGP